MAIKTHPLTHSLTLATLFALTACGGGGSDTAAPAPVVTTPAPVATSATAVTITSANAKALSAHALDTTQSALNYVGSVGFILANATPSASNISKFCPYGGFTLVTGGVANVNLLTQGDTYNSIYTNCAVLASPTTTLNGNSAVTATRSSGTSFPFNMGLSAKLSNFSLAIPNVKWLLNGDQQLTWSAQSNTVQTYNLSGTSLSIQTTSGGFVRNTLWKNYSQTIDGNGITTLYALSATVQTDNTNVGTAGGSYTVSTLTPVLYEKISGLRSAGVVKIAGAANSQIVATVGAGSVVTLQVDANGDGVFESTISTTFAELASFL